jgi:hypothetical protein
MQQQGQHHHQQPAYPPPGVPMAAAPSHPLPQPQGQAAPAVAYPHLAAPAAMQPPPQAQAWHQAAQPAVAGSGPAPPPLQPPPPLLVTRSDERADALVAHLEACPEFGLALRQAGAGAAITAILVRLYATVCALPC